MKKNIFIAVAFLLLSMRMLAGEGMWIPLYLGELNEQQMREMGMKISAKDIYDENTNSMKDAIVLFGGGCTGELISPEGLLLTNHHCGYDEIQYHSSVEHDYLTNGFWAMNKSEELPCPNLSVIFLIRMENVTEQVLENIPDSLDEKSHREFIAKKIKTITEKAVEGTRHEAKIVPFYCENQYYLFINEVFTDIRLVGAPPSNIGKFGGDTDNWMWPRHTGDFSMFRIYADQDNNPAEYSENNVPYRSKKYFEIALNGVKEDDFTFVFGYPARTSEYLPSYTIEETVETTNPIRIEMRTKRLNIMLEEMEKDPKIRIQYASKYAHIANGWKKWQGENLGITRFNGIKKKQDFEQTFQTWTNNAPILKAQYGNILPSFQKSYTASKDYQTAYVYFNETVNAIELLDFAGEFDRLITQSKEKTPDAEKIGKEMERLRTEADAFFKDYYQPIDKKIAKTCLNAYLANVSSEFIPIDLSTSGKKDLNVYLEKIFDKSIFSNQEKLNKFFDDFSPSRIKTIENDPAYQLIANSRAFMKEKVTRKLQSYALENAKLQRAYMQAQMEMQSDRIFYPDANFTLRVTYGNVKGFEPKNGVAYNYFTTLKGIMEKENPDIYDYVVEPKLKTLYQNKDFGRYADSDGSMHVAFVATNHTTGGNSGSPVLNANGQLVGINFDRCWEGTMSDLMYDPDVCRNISIDIRYCLFIIDKFAGAGYLLNEMTIVQ